MKQNNQDENTWKDNDDRVWRANPTKDIKSWSTKTDGDGRIRKTLGGARPEPEPGEETIDQWYERQFDEEKIYEKTWFIILAILLFWPLGLVLLVYKVFLKKDVPPPPLSGEGTAYEQQAGQAARTAKSSKSPGKSSKVAGWILVILGILMAISTVENFSITVVLYATAFCVGGVLLILSGKRKEGTFTSFADRRAERAKAKAEAKRAEEEKRKAEEEARAREALSIEEKQQLKIQEAIQAIEDTDMVRSLCEIDNSLRRINLRLKDKPELAKMSSVVKMKETFLPKTVELVEKYRGRKVSVETLDKIKEMLVICAEAFKEIEEKVYERENIDTQVDIEVLKQTLEREGLLGSDFDIDNE